MGEHNLLNPGFVGPLVNIHTGDTFYFPNFRASGAQLPGLPSLSYPRRDNVCSLPWPSAEPCNGYPQPYLGSPVSLNPPFGRTCELARVEDSKGYYREPCAEGGGGGLKREERGRDPGPAVGPGTALLPLEPSGPPALGFKYDYGAGGGGDGGAGPPHDPPSCQSLESDSSSSLLNEGNKGAGAGDPGSLVSPLNASGGLSASGKHPGPLWRLTLGGTIYQGGQSRIELGPPGVTECVVRKASFKKKRGVGEEPYKHVNIPIK